MPQTDELLTEIRDLLKGQQEMLKRSHRTQVIGMSVKTVFYVAIIVFSIYSAYIYAQTILSMTSGM